MSQTRSLPRTARSLEVASKIPQAVVRLWCSAEFFIIEERSRCRTYYVVTKWRRNSIRVCWCFSGKVTAAVRVKVKVWTLAIVPLTWVRLATNSALQSRKWQLIGMSQWCRSALCGHPLPALTDSLTHDAASRHTIAPISHTRPSHRSRSYYSFPVPPRDGEGRRLSRGG